MQLKHYLMDWLLFVPAPEIEVVVNGPTPFRNWQSAKSGNDVLLAIVPTPFDEIKHMNMRWMQSN